MSGPNFDQRRQNVDEQYNAGGDINIETHREDNPYVEQEEFQSAGCMAKTFMISGGIVMALGFLSFVGVVIMGMMGLFNSANNAAAGGQFSPFPFLSSLAMAPIGFGVLIVGMIVYSIGRFMARGAAYKNRMRSPRYSSRARY